MTWCGSYRFLTSLYGVDRCQRTQKARIPAVCVAHVDLVEASSYGGSIRLVVRRRSTDGATTSVLIILHRCYAGMLTPHGNVASCLSA